MSTSPPPPPPSRPLRLLSSGPATVLLLLLLLLVAGAGAAAPELVGVSPQDAQYYFTSAEIACRDGSGSFARSRLNDGFCDCADGTDEPGTSACPEGKFYCRNIGDSPRFLFSSRVNDRICDCCDGSDEYDSGINCPNTCKKRKDTSTIDDDSGRLSVANLEETDAFASKHQVDLQDLIQKLRGLRIAVIIELGFAISLFAFCLAHRRTRTRRRHNFLRS